MKPLGDLKIEPLNVSIPPVRLYQALRKMNSRSFLLESAVDGTRTVSYSFMGFGPEKIYKYDPKRGTGNIDDLRLALERGRTTNADYPFIGGLVGYLGYDFSNLIEGDLNIVSGEYPTYELGEYDEGFIYDHSKFQILHFHHGHPKLPAMLDDLPSEEDIPRLNMRTRSSSNPDGYTGMVERVKRKIADGEAFQVVLSVKEDYDYDGDPFSLYLSLREVNPSPYMYYLDFGERKVLGSSPETLVRLRGREVTTFPIAGTRPMGIDPMSRKRYRRELLSDEKERAEHCMLVDLSRNDLGKVCKAGSVEVRDFMRVQEFSHVQHLVSKVTGVLEEGRDSFDAIMATFPAGTVSGAPKHRAMEMIQTEEGDARGPYAGAVGYLSFNGNMDMAITIRSAFFDEKGGSIRAGAGIVMDSVAEREYQECQSKLQGMRSAISRSKGADA